MKSAIICACLGALVGYGCLFFAVEARLVDAPRLTQTHGILLSIFLWGGAITGAIVGLAGGLNRQSNDRPG